MTDTAPDVAAVRAALAQGPTPGPWNINQGRALRVASADDVSIASAGTSGLIRDQWEANATYIAACHPERIARLLDALEAATKDAQRWRELYRKAVNEANGLTNYVEDRPELRRAERNLTAIEAEARAIVTAMKEAP